MAITVVGSRPTALVAAIKKAIDNKHIQTWSYTAGGDLTHSPPQWKNKAWLRPLIVGTSLQFGVIRPKVGSVSKEVFGIFQGRFIEMLIVHFPEAFTKAEATSQAAGNDLV